MPIQTAHYDLVTTWREGMRSERVATPLPVIKPTHCCSRTIRNTGDTVRAMQVAALEKVVRPLPCQQRMKR